MTFPDADELANMDVDEIRAMMCRMKQREAKKAPAVEPLDETDDLSEEEQQEAVKRQCWNQVSA